MKVKLLTLVLLFTLTIGITSCEQNEPNYSKSYVVTFKETEGYKMTAYIFEYNNQGDKVYNHVIEKVEKGKPYAYNSQKETIKIKIYYEVESIIGDYNKWIQRVYYLDDKNNTTEIIINEGTTIGNFEP